MEEKTKKEKRQEALAEGVLEIVFYLLFLGVGFLVYWVWSLVFSANIATMDPDTLVLIGLIALAVIVAAICWLKKLIKSREKRAVATCHNMKLHAGPFEKIKSGVKTIELRLYDEKRQQIKEGDAIIFTNTATGEKLTATVQKLHRFASFEELYKALPLLQCGYTAEDIDSASPADMAQYYSAEEQEKYGVVGIELCEGSVHLC